MFCFCILSSYVLLRVTLCVIFPYLEVKAQQCFVSSRGMFLGKKTLLKIWLNPGLNLNIFPRTRPCRFLTCKTNMSCFLDIPATLGTPSKASSICCANNKTSRFNLKRFLKHESLRNTDPRYEEGRSFSTPYVDSSSFSIKF